jgi:hypothetical protein
MAQCGSFVPASEAHIGYFDKIFTRVGASDNISRGESTFMVEMLETAMILNNLSARSLVLLDEIGRGTSTYDGMSIARGIVEFIHEYGKGAKTLFATHYHELNDLEGIFPRVKNFHVAVKEVGKEVIFLRKLREGGTAHSFGIHVARMAGMPQQVLESAERTLKALAAEQGVDGRMTVVSQSGYGFAEAVDGEPDFVDVRLKAPRASYRGPRIGTGDADIKAYLLPVYRFETKRHALLGSKDGIQLNAAANYARFNLVSLVERHRLSGSTVPLKAVILGCTHYPFHLETMQKVVRELREYRKDGGYPYRDLLAEDLVFIDPAHDTAVECYRLLREDGLLAEEGTAAVDAFISVPAAEIDPACLTPDGKLTYEFKYGRNPGDDPCTRPVPFSRSNLDPENLARIRTMLPRSYSLIEPGL